MRKNMILSRVPTYALFWTLLVSAMTIGHAQQPMLAARQQAALAQDILSHGDDGHRQRAVSVAERLGPERMSDEIRVALIELMEQLSDQQDIALAEGTPTNDVVNFEFFMLTVRNWIVAPYGLVIYFDRRSRLDRERDDRRIGQHRGRARSGLVEETEPPTSPDCSLLGRGSHTLPAHPIPRSTNETYFTCNYRAGIVHYCAARPRSCASEPSANNGYNTLPLYPQRCAVVCARLREIAPGIARNVRMDERWDARQPQELLERSMP